MSGEMDFDLKRFLLNKLERESLVRDALKEKTPKRRVGMIMSAMKKGIEVAPLGNFNGELWRFGGKCYKKMPESEFGALVNDILEELGLPYEDLMLSDKVQKVCRNEAMKKILTPMTNIVVFENCVFDVNTRMEYAFNPKYVQMSMVHYNHSYNDQPFEFLTFLEYVLPDETKRKVLQEFLGSIFIDRKKAKMEKILILLGSGANGKSVIFDTVVGVLGRDNVSNFGLGNLISGGDRKHCIAGINGKRLNYCSEIRAIEIGQDSDSLKTLISGEPIEARVLNGQYFMARNIPLLMANANKMPRITDMTHGMKRRLCVLRFNVTVPKEMQDPLLSEKMVGEYSGVFNWIIKGRERFIKNGYKLSYVPNVEDIVMEQAEDDSSVIKFMRKKKWYAGEEESGEPCVWRRGSFIYKEYVHWAIAESIIPESANMFGRELNTSGYKKRRTSKGYEYALFGKEAKKTVVMDAADVKKVISQKKDRTASAWTTIDGTPMILGNRRLASALGVGLKTVDKCMKEGWFEGCYEPVASGWHAFDLMKCKRVLVEHEIYKTGFRMEELRSERAQQALERKTFNKRMEALGLPYRKRKHKNEVPEGYVWVADDMDVNTLLKQEFGDVMDENNISVEKEEQEQE